MKPIVFPLRPQMQGSTVAGLQEALTLLGLSIADAEKRAQRYGASTRQAVRKFQTGHRLSVTGVVDEATASVLNKILAERGVLDDQGDGDSPQDPLFSVEGEVVKPDDTPLPKHVVRAYDRALCDWRLLGDPEVVVRTNEHGRYEISYNAAQLTQWGKTRADLKVEVLDPETGDTVLAESPLILRARPHETVNFSIGPQRYRGVDEFTRVERALAPLLQSQNDLSCLEVADVLILAREAKLASSNVAYYVKARRWSAEFDAPAAIFYGLMRRGEPTRIDALLARPLARLWAKLEEAKSRNLINLPLTDGMQTQLAQLQQSYLARPENPLASVLGTTMLTGEQSTLFTQRLAAGGLTGDEFWQALEAEASFSAENVADLREAFELESFADNTSLTVRLRGDLAVRAPREVAAFSVEQWRDTVLDGTAVEIPDEVLPGGTAAERRLAYAQMLYRRAERGYPTPSVAGQLMRDPLPGQDSLQRFFSVNPDFEFADKRVLNFLRERPQALQGLPETARDELLQFEHLFHLVPPEDKLAVIEPLWSAGLRSAPQVAYLGRSNLMRRVGAALDTKAANRIYRKAVHVTSLALNVYLRFHPALNRLSLAALQLPQLPNALPTSQAVARSHITMPEWDKLFGSPDACECSHCASALSPAAYVVDIMAHLEKAVDADGNNALDELLARRPDIGTLRLTCENAETPLPHIDLVNEILEDIVASADGKTLSGAAIGETTWDSDLLAAQPQYLRSAAYDIVRLSLYPFYSLPFDLWAEEGRRYLRQTGIARDELMQAMPAKPGVSTLDIATEALGMSSVERDLIRRPRTRPANLAPRWGIDLAQGTLGAQLASVEVLIKQAHIIDYDTLLRLLNTRYVNPERLISVSFAGTPCSLDGAVLVGEGGVALVDEPFRKFLDRLHRFLRLQRRLACPEYDLDTLIDALGATDFNAPAFFSKLADMQALRGTLRLSLPELSAWWADLDTYAPEEELPSQYEAIYQNEALFPDTHTGVGPDLRNAVFALREDRADLAITTSPDTSLSPWLAESDAAEAPIYTLEPDYAAYIQSATRLTADDVLLLVQELLPKDATTGHVALNLANASLLYRMASLTRALKIGVKDALRLVAITGVVPLRTASAAASPIGSRRFQDRFSEIDAGTRSVEELAYLLLHESTAVTILAPTTEGIDAWLASISPSFKGIFVIDDERITAELKTSLTQSLAAALSVDQAVLDALLFTHRAGLGDEVLTHVIIAANVGASGLTRPLREFTTVFGQLHKFGLAWNGLALDLSFLPFVLDRGPRLGWTDIAALPMAPPTSAQFEPWRRLVAAADLQASTFTLEQPLFTLMEDAAAATALQAEDPASFVLSDFLAQISEWTTWPLTDVTYLTGANGFNLDLPAAMRDEQALVGLKRVFDLIRTKGVAAEQAHAWTSAELTFAETQSIKQTLSLAYAPDRWLEILGSIQDELRTLKRDALLGHLLTTLGMEDSDAFYSYYLIDADQSPRDRTSRIVLAISAVQLFAQRILLNLEAFKFERQEAEAWQWRKKYRVWEAARKVFLWPENWVEPDLRDNKSAFFKDLEAGLLQDDVTHENAEKLYLQYLLKINDIRQLEIMGMYHEDVTEEQPAVLHVFGRTRDVPHRYFYRRWEDEARWTPLEPVELDINADHLIPMVSNARLYLFWPEFTQSDNPNPTSTTETTAEVLDPERYDEIDDLLRPLKQRRREVVRLLEDATGNDFITLSREKADLDIAIEILEAEQEDLIVLNTTTIPGDKYLMELGMRWSEYRDGRWMGTVISKDKLSYTSSESLERHYFTGWVGNDNVVRISARINEVGIIQGLDDPRSTEGYIGYFYFDECGGNLVASSVSVSDPAGEVMVTNAHTEFHSAWWDDTNSSPGSLELEIGAAPEKRLLITTHGSLYYAHQDGQYGKEMSPFFFSDGVRTYFVQLVPDRPWLDELDFTAVGRGSQNRSATASTLRGARSQRTISANDLTTTATEHHFEASDSMLIINRDGADLFTSSLPDVIGTLIEQDPAPEITIGTLATPLRYRFTSFYHPNICLFLKQQSRYGVDGLLNPDPAWGPDSAELYRQLLPSNSFDFEDIYKPNRDWVDDNFSSEQVGEQIDFDHWSPYGWSNWELFFHIPRLIATRLMENQRYADARRWFHYIFDPTVTDDGAGPERFWKIKPFYEEQLNGQLASLEALLTEGNMSYEQQVEAWERDPFKPDVIARLRISAYMQAVVMGYTTCLLKEADMLFLRETREDTDEARQLYLLAAAIFGDRPYLLPAQQASSLTPNLLLERFRFDWNNWNDLPGHNNPLDLLASFLPADRPGAPAARSSAGTASGPIAVDASVASSSPGASFPAGTSPTSASSGASTLSAQGGTSSVDTLLLFCIPRNEMLYDFWATVADRLFKIRHSMNLSGQVRQLALYAPPIDPGLLVRAVAAGMSIEAILSGLFAPRSIYRFSFTLQKALELCAEVRSLGGAMLAALEKQDGEQLSILRSTHEVALLKSLTALKQKSVEEAESSLAGLVKSRESAELRAAFYSSLERISVGEQTGLDKQEESRLRQRDAEIAETLASVLHIIPSWPGGAFGGPNLGSAAQAVAAGFRGRSAYFAFEANKIGTMAGYDRRLEDWKFQGDLAKKEIAQLDKQIIAAEIRKQIAEADRNNLEKQIAQAQEVEDFLKLKFSNQDLYSWMVSKLASVHFQAYDMAYQLAMQTEAAFLQELGPDEQSLTFIKPDNWDSLKKGLVASDLLVLQLRQMEAAHMAAHKRELEITKHVSLLQLDPEALLALRETGFCEFHLSEVLYAMDFAGHYYRRIKSVRITIPCVVGPYTNVSATLSLINSWTRRNTDLSDAEQPVQDTVASPQTAIATSSATQDSGAFELAFDHPRYLPFEGAGAISTWGLELPSTIRPFDYATIADVVMHVSYTARDGGPDLKASVNAGLLAALNDLKALIAAGATMSRLFSLRYESPTAWNLLVNASGGATRTCTLQLSKQHFPSFLAYAWNTLEDDTTEIKPITLVVKNLSAHLSPRGPVPTDAGDIKLNEQPAKPVIDWSIPTFDLTSALTSALSSTSIGNTDVITCELTIDGAFRAEDWNDLYLLMDYEVLA